MNWGSLPGTLSVWHPNQEMFQEAAVLNLPVSKSETQPDGKVLIFSKAQSSICRRLENNCTCNYFIQFYPETPFKKISPNYSIIAALICCVRNTGQVGPQDLWVFCPACQLIGCVITVWVPVMPSIQSGSWIKGPLRALTVQNCF